MRLLLLIFLSACAVVHPAPTIVDAGIVEKSHQVMLAYDHGDVAELGATLAAVAGDLRQREAT